MPICKKCSGSLPNRIKIWGRILHTQRRKYCLKCSPIGSGNRSKYFADPSKKPSRGERWKRWQRKARRERKDRLIAMFGGRCARCGYDRCRSALVFHHINPATKAFGLANYGMCRKWDDLVAEARKCVLLCLNCHAETHQEIEDARVAGSNPAGHAIHSRRVRSGPPAGGPHAQ